MTLEQYARRAGGIPRASDRAQANRAAGRRAELHLVFRGSAHDAVPGAGDAARRAHLRAGGHPQELDAYNPLIPDGSNWKVTLLIEFPDPDERRGALERLKGVEDRCWVQVAGHERVFAIADEDLERENDEKTSAVHFLRFELDAQMRAALHAGAALGVGIDHDQYRFTCRARAADARARRR